MDRSCVYVISHQAMRKAAAMASELTAEAKQHVHF